MKKSFLFLVFFSFSYSFSEEKLQVELKPISQASEEEISKEETSKDEISKTDEEVVSSKEETVKVEVKEISVDTKSTGEKQTPENQVAESFSENAEEATEGDGLLTSFFENYSWFFEKKKTKNKIAIIPSFYVSSSLGTIVGLRLFTYSVDKSNYMGTSFSNQIFSSFIQWDFNYINRHKLNFEVHSYVSYDNFLEPFYGEGMDTKESDLKNFYAHNFHWNHEVKYVLQNKVFSSLVGQVFFRKERPDLQGGDIHFDSEFLFQLKGKIGYDSRDSWENPEKGHYHQFSFGCVPSLGEGSSFCLGEIDLRYYNKFFDRYSIALRSFLGSSFISHSSYSMNYTLGGRNVLRGFSENRFRGDKAYFVQSEVRSPLPLWGRYFSGALFAELGEVAQYGEKFKGFKWNLGTGFRVGIPPNYKMKLRIDVGFAPLDSEKKINFLVDFFQAF